MNPVNFIAIVFTRKNIGGEILLKVRQLKGQLYLHRKEGKKVRPPTLFRASEVEKVQSKKSKCSIMSLVEMKKNSGVTTYVAFYTLVVNVP